MRQWWGLDGELLSGSIAKKKQSTEVFVLANSKTGFVYDFLLYTGSEITSRPPHTFAHLPIPGQFVATLMDNLVDFGHVVYIDRYYTSVLLADTLASRGIYWHCRYRFRRVFLMK